MSQVLRLPAPGCSHFLRGRCLYEEHLNPGYHADYRCVVLTRLGEVYDTFLNQADAFGLDEALAGDIWQKRLGQLSEADTGCQEHEPGDTEGFPDCAHCLGDVCVLRLPACGGRCQHFSTSKRGSRSSQS